MTVLESAMKTAIHEARLSLREGNHGFGAVLLNEGEIIAQAHDEEETIQDSTSHAELNVIHIASKKLGKNLSKCILLSTHEPCPMCASAIVWSGIHEIGFGYSIKKSLEQGRNRINLSCDEVFKRAGKSVIIHSDILHEECSVLYLKSVRDEVKRLRNVSEEALSFYNTDSIQRRLMWFNEKKESFDFISKDLLDSAYKLLLHRFNTNEKEMPVVFKNEKKIIFHSMNFCPTLEACKILNLDTRSICKAYNENATETLIKQISPSLRFSRNYESLRPNSEYCEEIITKED